MSATISAAISCVGDRLLIATLSIASLAASGCSGATYAQHSAIDLNVATRPNEENPIQVNLGWDRGLVAVVPKREDNEASAILSTENARVVTDYSSFDDNSLAVEATFVTGKAAVVLVQPRDEEVVVVSETRAATIAVETTGTPAARVAAAFRTSTRFSCEDQARIDAAMDDALKRPSNEQRRIFDDAAAGMSEGYRTLYRQARINGDPAARAFGIAAQKWTHGESGCGPRLAETANALDAALN